MKNWPTLLYICNMSTVKNPPKLKKTLVEPNRLLFSWGPNSLQGPLKECKLLNRLHKALSLKSWKFSNCGKNLWLAVPTCQAYHVPVPNKRKYSRVFLKLLDKLRLSTCTLQHSNIRKLKYCDIFFIKNTQVTHSKCSFA